MHHQTGRRLKSQNGPYRESKASPKKLFFHWLPTHWWGNCLLHSHPDGLYNQIWPQDSRGGSSTHWLYPGRYQPCWYLRYDGSHSAAPQSPQINNYYKDRALATKFSTTRSSSWADDGFSYTEERHYSFLLGLGPQLPFTYAGHPSGQQRPMVFSIPVSPVRKKLT